ncbi:FAD:protein FMN transferase [Paenirhodobacter hankyongi]|uniref:FAD:protein FMN transferase n=1 Tax=Paenirhodobacter hankyongi TaxID=2294033 RepID=A0A421BNC7_9RHOB|nr:FAD:protein FMN transferase [Sinirhodobacter hankyongi]RLL64427.1 FAD:protein FMN transferase [Sinirhodobacter hankyongi]
MPKTSSDLPRRALSGSTMGTRWSVVLYAPEGADLAPLAAALQQAVDEVDAQMSTWRPESDLMRLNAAPLDVAVPLPARLMTVLAEALEIGRLSGGAFEIAMGDAVAAWGFGPAPADPAAIRAAMARPRRPSFEGLELDRAAGTACKRAEMTLDLSGIAKGYGVDALVEVLGAHGITRALAVIDGELRGIGTQPDGRGWAVAVERPDPALRAVHSVFELHDIAIATSGDYRHRVEVGGRQLSHTMDPRRGAPVLGGPASVTVLAETCMRADAVASALMVLGEAAGRALAGRLGVEVLFLTEADRLPA